MKVLIINATMRKQTTYNIAKSFISKLNCETEIEEIFLPDAMPKFCLGCGNCFMVSEKNCPHYEFSKAILEKMLNADLLVFANPVYVFHTTGQMKTLLDHYGYMWLIHRPSAQMFVKQAVVISTAAGGGTKSANKDIVDSLRFWGVARIHTYGINVKAASWKSVKKEIKEKIDKDVTKLAKKIELDSDKVKPMFISKMYFYIFRGLQKKGFSKIDQEYWDSKGWLGRNRPFNK